MMSQQKLIKFAQPKYFFWLSVFFHIFFLLIMYLLSSYASVPIMNEKYYYYVPSYVSDSSPAPKASRASTSIAKNVESTTDIDEMMKADDGILNQYKKNPAQQNLLNDPEMLTQLSQQLMGNTSNQKQDEEPIQLVGDKFLDDPFRKLLGRAITAHLFYPELAKELHLRGVVSIGFVLHPDGTVTDAQITKSSHEKILDEAAL